MMEDGKKSHFGLFTNMSSLFARQMGYKHHYKHHCDSCLLFYKSSKKFESNRRDCLKINKNATKFPDENYIFFGNTRKQTRCPFIIYGDCESFLVPTTEGKLSGTIQKHKLFSVGLYVHSDIPDLVDCGYESRRGPDAGEWFVKRLIHYAETINHIIKYTNHEMNANTREKLKFIIAHKCYLCDKPFTDENYKVADHDHLTGKYRGAAHNECNLKARKDYTIPVVMHNFLGYDLHLLIRHIAKKIPKIGVIAKTCEDYVCVTLYVPNTKVRLLLLDSYKFLPGSLSNLAKLLPDEDKRLIKEEFEKNHTLLLEKLCFPYEYVTGWDVLEQTELPSIEKFHSQLTGESITSNDYNHTKRVWSTFEITNLGQLADLYM